jgi:zinc protease
LGPVLLVLGPVASGSALARSPEIPFEKYSLSNGLDVILHVERAAPTVHVEILYQVGSRHEPPGQTGLAHLVERLMFQGTKHFPRGAYFRYLADAGATARSGHTDPDHSVYFQTLPASHLELALWLESSRMGFLLEQPNLHITLEDQRQAVQSEWRRRFERTPLGGLEKVLLQALFAPTHPYAHPVIGWPADVAAVRTPDLQRFFQRHLCPNNAVLVIAGDIDLPTTKGLVKKYFGPIPRGSEIERRPPPAASLAGEVRIAMEAPVDLARVVLAWHTAPVFAEGNAEMDAIAQILAGGRSSRLQRRLVQRGALAESVTATQKSLAHSGRLEIAVTVRSGRETSAVLAVLDEEIGRLRTELVTPRELEGARNRFRTAFFRSIETLPGRASLLARYHHLARDPGFIARDLTRYEALDPTAVRTWAEKLLRQDARVVITIDPNPAAPLPGRIIKRKGARS